MIIEKSIEEVKQASDIVDVIIDNGIQLKKKGSNYVGPCPFHSEKSASFTVTTSKQIYKCFGCGASGDSIEFLIKHKGFQFIEAIEWLANKYNIALEYDGNEVSKEEKGEKKSAYEFMSEIKRFYHKSLKENAEAYQYLINRGFTEETIALWELGYAPESWTSVKDIAIKKNCYDLSVKCGLVLENGDKNRDFFYNRIIIPIHDDRGNCVSFGGRIWTKDQDDRKDAKYLNGPESFIYDKGKVIFGLHVALQSISKLQEAILVEGYFDVIMSHQNELKNVIATCGTSVTESHVKSIVKRTKTIVFAGDNDTAGQKSINNSIDLFLQAGAIDLSIIDWPEDTKDIDEFLKTYKSQNETK